jgi:activator of 2-hydroxyglutaryl-CoA dehydratase
MIDFLYVSYEFIEENGKTGLCIGREKENGNHEILKVLLDERAQIIYNILTSTNSKEEEAAIKEALEEFEVEKIKAENENLKRELATFKALC